MKKSIILILQNLGKSICVGIYLLTGAEDSTIVKELHLGKSVKWIIDKLCQFVLYLASLIEKLQN